MPTPMLFATVADVLCCRTRTSVTAFAFVSSTVATSCPPLYIDLAMPTPPAVLNAPVVDEVEAVDGCTATPVSPKTVKAVASTGVNRISVGSITHSVPAVDFKLEI